MLIQLNIDITMIFLKQIVQIKISIISNLKIYYHKIGKNF